MKFNAHSSEQTCGRRVPGELSDRYADLGGLACVRIAGHPGDCTALAREAGAADGVHWCCREQIEGPHAGWCPSRGEPDV